MADPADRSRRYWMAAARAVGLVVPSLCASVQWVIEQTHHDWLQLPDVQQVMTAAECEKTRNCGTCKPLLRGVANTAKTLHHGKPTQANVWACELRSNPVEFAKLFMAKLGDQAADKNDWADFDVSSLLNVLTYAKKFADEKDPVRDTLKRCSTHRNEFAHAINQKSPFQLAIENLKELLHDLLELLRATQFDKVAGERDVVVKQLEELNQKAQSEEGIELSDTDAKIKFKLCSLDEFRGTGSPLLRELLVMTQSPLEPIVIESETSDAQSLERDIVYAFVRNKWVPAVADFITEAENLAVRCFDGAMCIKGVVPVKVESTVRPGHRLTFGPIPGVLTTARSGCLAVIGMCLSIDQTTATPQPPSPPPADDTPAVAPDVDEPAAVGCMTAMCIFFCPFGLPGDVKRSLRELTAALCSQGVTQADVEPNPIAEEAEEDGPDDAKDPGLYCSRHHCVCSFDDLLAIVTSGQGKELSVKPDKLPSMPSILIEEKDDESREETPDRPSHVMCRQCFRLTTDGKLGVTVLKRCQLDSPEQQEFVAFARKCVILVGPDGKPRTGKQWTKTDLSGIDRMTVFPLSAEVIARPLPPENADKLGLLDFDWPQLRDHLVQNVVADDVPPRDYQWDLIRRALRPPGALVGMLTGMGKTLVGAVAAGTVLANDPSAIAIFIAPTNALVQQQGRQLLFYLRGAFGVTLRSGGQTEDLGEGPLRILVATPMAFHELTNFKDLVHRAGIFVLDEAHKGCTKSPLSTVLKKVKKELAKAPDAGLPLVVGLTAVPGEKKQEILQLCQALSFDEQQPLRPVTCDLSNYSNLPTPEWLPAPQDPHDELARTCLMEANCRAVGRARAMQYGQLVQHHQGKPYLIPRLHLHNWIEMVGLQFLVARHCLEDQSQEKNAELCKFLDARVVPVVGMVMDGSHRAVGGKLRVVLDRLLNGSHCIVYVHKVDEVKQVCEWVAAAAKLNPKSYGWIKVDWIAGKRHVSLDQAKEKLRKFRKGEVNVLISTPVLEEGIDVADCDTVVLFDAAATFTAVVQWKGRARKTDAKFLSFNEGDIDVLKRERDMLQLAYDIMMDQDCQEGHSA